MTMAFWGLTVAAALLIGLLPFFIGVAIVMPILGHSTWHLYRKVIIPDPAQERPIEWPNEGNGQSDHDRFSPHSFLLFSVARRLGLFATPKFWRRDVTPRKSHTSPMGLRLYSTLLARSAARSASRTRPCTGQMPKGSPALGNWRSESSGRRTGVRRHACRSGG